MPALLCSTHLLSSKSRAETHPLLASGNLRSGFLPGLDHEFRLLWRSCVLSGAVGAICWALAWGRKEPSIGKSSIWAQGSKPGTKQMSVSGLIRVRAEQGLSVCAVQAGPELLPVKLIQQLGANPLLTAAGSCWCLGILQLTPLPAAPSASPSLYLLVHSQNSTRLGPATEQLLSELEMHSFLHALTPFKKKKSKQMDLDYKQLSVSPD